jgi:hypothetical protein
MSWYAIDAVEDALTATRRFLLPFEWGTWLRLAIVAFFLGGVGTPPNTFNYTFSGDDMGFVQPDISLPSDQIFAAIIAIAVIVFLIGLIFALIGAVMQFVLVDAVVDREVHVRRFFSERLDKGLRLFGFQLVFGLLILGLVALFIGPIVLTGGGPALALILFAIPVFLLVGLLIALIFRLTTDFVVPVMIVRDEGILAAWRTTWPTIRSNLGQVAIYIAMRWVLGIAIGIGVGLIVGIVGLALGIIVLLPLGLIGFAIGGAGPVTIALLLIIGIPLLLAFLLLMAVIQVPVQTYFRYFSLLVLSELNAEFDLLGEFGASVKADESE